MADGGFDPCECINILNHEQRMQRLISMLRNSQSVCNDNECFNEVTGPNTSGVMTPSDDMSVSFMTIMIGWMLIAMILYFLRPNTWRRTRTSESGDKKHPSNDHRRRNGDDEPVL